MIICILVCSLLLDVTFALTKSSSEDDLIEDYSDVPLSRTSRSVNNAAFYPQAPAMPQYGSPYYSGAPLAPGYMGNNYPAQYYFPPMPGQPFPAKPLVSTPAPKRDRRESGGSTESYRNQVETRPTKRDFGRKGDYDYKSVEEPQSFSKYPRNSLNRRPARAVVFEPSIRRSNKRSLGPIDRFLGRAASASRRRVRAKQVGKMRVDELPPPFEMTQPITLRIFADKQSGGQVQTVPMQVPVGMPGQIQMPVSTPILGSPASVVISPPVASAPTIQYPNPMCPVYPTTVAISQPQATPQICFPAPGYGVYGGYGGYGGYQIPVYHPSYTGIHPLSNMNLMYPRYPAFQYPGYQYPGYQYPGYQHPGYHHPGYQYPGYHYPGYQYPGYQYPGYPATYPWWTQGQSNLNNNQRPGAPIR